MKKVSEILEEKENGAEYEKPRVTVRQIPKKTERLVINRLNRINSEKRLAKIIEIPGRRDVGINVAHNIITQKKKLGKFTTIDEIYNVKGVGPQRLNDIVLSLSKKRLG